jgi:hypothetical protein
MQLDPSQLADKIMEIRKNNNLRENYTQES